MNKLKAYGIALYKHEDSTVKLLLCKSIRSDSKWGFLKGAVDRNDTTPKGTAQREFQEESGIFIHQYLLTKYFYQENEEKDIGIYLVDATKLDYIFKYFNIGFFYFNNRFRFSNNSSSTCSSIKCFIPPKFNHFSTYF